MNGVLHEFRDEAVRRIVVRCDANRFESAVGLRCCRRGFEQFEGGEKLAGVPLTQFELEPLKGQMRSEVLFIEQVQFRRRRKASNQIGFIARLTWRT